VIRTIAFWLLHRDPRALRLWMFAILALFWTAVGVLIYATITGA